ncbi:MAG: OmpA family protein [Bacteroides sp.]|nr:OmpA family protein [Bacteroides sp.]
MKAKNLYCLAAMCAGAFAAAPAANAQDVFESETLSVTEYTCDNSNHYFQSWRDNWFIQIGAGINQPFVERGIGQNAPGHDVDRKRMTTTYNFGVGHWFSPYLALRFNALGGALHWDTPVAPDMQNGWTKAKYANLNLELMWDMCNSLGGVNPNRPVSVIPFVGIGGAYTWDIRDAYQQPAAAANIHRDGKAEYKNSSWTLPVTAGIQFRFRLCKYVDFFAEARASFFGDNWNGVAYGSPIEANVAAVGGFNFNIGGRGWNVYNECTYVSQLADLNNQVNTLRGQLLNAAQENAALRAQLPCPEVVQKDCVNAPLMTTVRFTINSDKIMPTEEVNVYNMAEWLKANPSENVVIVGYADKDTGTAEYNLGLSERRANAVADELVNKYGISRSRLTVNYDGSNVQPYSENDWNRIVIFTQK